jgi:hypothetical protein
MNEEMRQAWLEISQMLGEPTREELDVFMRTWQRAVQATRKTLAQPTWVGLTDEERKLVRTSIGYNQFVTASEYAEHVQKATEFKLWSKNEDRN